MKLSSLSTLTVAAKVTKVEAACSPSDRLASSYSVLNINHRRNLILRRSGGPPRVKFPPRSDRPDRSSALVGIVEAEGSRPMGRRVSSRKGTAGTLL